MTMQYILKKTKRPAVLSIVLVIILAVFNSCTFLPDDTEPVITPGTSTTPPVTDPDISSGNPSSTPPPDSQDEADELLSEMTLEEKIGQMFFIGSRYNSEGTNQYDMDGALEEKLKKYKPGGFIFFAENIDSIPQTVELIQKIRQSAEIPIFIGIDEEGGIVSRLNKAQKIHSTVMPEPFAIGGTKNSEYAYKAARAISEEIGSLGFNLDFAPVADVFSNPENKVIGKRAYSDDPAVAAEMVAEAVKGMDDSGIIPVLKHFPGHGDTLQDSHTGVAVVKNDLERLRQVEFLPFKAGIAAGADIVMTAHVMTPEITQNDLPATLSKPMIDILRNELSFDGIIITDGLEMSAITALYKEEDAVVMAVQAGVDMLLLPKDLESAFNAVLTAVRDGRISEERIDGSVKRILKLKLEKLTDKPGEIPDPDPDPEEALGSKEHRDLAEQIRRESIK